MKGKDIAIIAGGFIGFALWQSGKLNDLQNSLGGGGSGGGGGTFSFDFSDLFSGFGGGGGIIPTVPEFPGWEGLIPDLPPFDWDNYIPDIPDFPGWDELFKIPEIPGLPGLPDIPGLPDLPESGGFGLNPNTVQTEVARLGGIAGRQYLSAFTISKNIVKPLPFAEDVAKAGGITKDVLKVIAGGSKVREVSIIPKGIAELGSRLTAPVIEKTAASGAAKIAGKAIPFIGWASLIADAGADVVRLFGVDVTEWLGFSGLISPFLGYNPLEKWVSEGTEAVGASAQLTRAEDWSKVNTTILAGLSSDKQLAFVAAGSGPSPESPGRTGTGEWDHRTWDELTQSERDLVKEHYPY